MAKLIGGNRDIGTLIRFAAQAAYGASTAEPGMNSSGMANAGTPSKISIMDRVRGGFEAVSPIGRDLRKDRDERLLTSAKINNLNAETRKTTAELERMNRPFNLKAALDKADPTGKLSGKVISYFNASGVNVNGDDTVTEEEVQKGLANDLISKVRLSELVGETVTDLSKQIQSLDGGEKGLAFRLSTLGLSESDFNNPAIAETYKKEAGQLRMIQDLRRKWKVLSDSGRSLMEEANREREIAMAERSPSEKRFEEDRDSNFIAAQEEAVEEIIKVQNGTSSLKGGTEKQLIQAILFDLRGRFPNQSFSRITPFLPAGIRIPGETSVTLAPFDYNEAQEKGR